MIERVRAALQTVVDPELDEPITSLGFVRSVTVGAGGEVKVRLRLPTPQCAPNFAFLMAADARRALLAVEGVSEVSVVLEDHYTGDEINAALARGEGFSSAFPGETDDDELESLRALFWRKALIARQSRLAEALLSGGADERRLCTARVRDLPDDPEARRCLTLRTQLGIASQPWDPALVSGDGAPLREGDLERWRRMARLVATSLEANGAVCRGLLAARTGAAGDEVELTGEREVICR
jgi:metal-sulfur cluster biosynthetic enzyme